jgi:hypothetical protein
MQVHRAEQDPFLSARDKSWNTDEDDGTEASVRRGMEAGT